MTQLLLTANSLSAAANTALNEALLLVEARLADWSSNQDAFHALLQQVFGVQPSTESGAVLATISGSGLGINLQILDATSIDDLIAAYTSAAPDGGERIYLNAIWLELATPDQIEAVLLEELGHAIDWRINGNSDSAGDEGAIFSALLCNQTPDPDSFRENDQRILSIDGVIVAVEASTDTTRPTGSLIRATAPAYTEQEGNTPFGIADVGNTASPAFADADGDGDLDLFIGNNEGNTLFFRNNGSANTPAFSQEGGLEPFGITDVTSSSPAFADADGDGDLDLFIGSNYYGSTLFFRNTAAAGATTPAFAAAVTNPFGIPYTGGGSNPAFADVDGDGDLDLFIGNYYGNTWFFRNTAVAGATSPAYTEQEGNTPFGIADVGNFASPAFADADGDGDLDLFIGNNEGNTLFFRNTGTASVPAYTQEGGTTPFGISDVGFYASPTFADIDGDGDLDLFIGNNEGNTLFFRNTAATPVAPVNATTANGTYGIDDFINLTVGFSEDVVVNTTGGTPRLQLETGNTDRYATYSSGSGSSTLTFQYTVQEGDTSSDLDQFSSSALALNGGNIKDAAGNNAILTLAAPGEAGSLGANAALIVETVRPTIAISSDATSLKAGETATISYLLSEASSNFVQSDVTVSGGALSNWNAASSTSYSSTFTASRNSAADGVISVANSKFSDAAGNFNNDVSDANNTVSIANVNDAPTGSVTISGTAKEGETLRAANTLADADGLGTITNQWKRAGTAISGATSSTYQLVQADVGSAISVTASYTDGQGTAESVTSSVTSVVKALPIYVPPSSPEENQQVDTAPPFTEFDDVAIGRKNFTYRMLGGNDLLEVLGGDNNFANGNQGDDRFVLRAGQKGQYLGGTGADTFEVFGGIDAYANGQKGSDQMILRGGLGRYLGGDDGDSIEVSAAVSGSWVNGNRGEDTIIGSVAGVTYRGGADADLMLVSQGDVYGDKGADTFRGVKGEGYAGIQDYTIGEDVVDLDMEGSWSRLDSGLMFTDDSGDQIMLLVGINETEQVTLV